MNLFACTKTIISSFCLQCTRMHVYVSANIASKFMQTCLCCASKLQIDFPTYISTDFHYDSCTHCPLGQSSYEISLITEVPCTHLQQQLWEKIKLHHKWHYPTSLLNRVQSPRPFLIKTISIYTHLLTFYKLVGLCRCFIW